MMQIVDKDALRFFILMKSADTTLDIDIQKMKEQSKDNPIFYVQYANARISNLLKRYDKEISAENKIDYSLLKAKDEIALVKLLSEFPICLVPVQA